MTHLDFLSSSRKVDAKGRLALKKDCDEVYPQIIIGTGDCIKDVSNQLYLFIYIHRFKNIQCNANFITCCRDSVSKSKKPDNLLKQIKLASFFDSFWPQLNFFTKMLEFEIDIEMINKLQIIISKI